MDAWFSLRMAIISAAVWFPLHYFARNPHGQSEFGYSPDERFHPVFAANEPDGTLYFADMHRGIVEGEIFMTSFLRNQIVERRLQHPFRGEGRIYRLGHRARSRRMPPAISRENSAAWVERLAHANGFWRDTAQRVLVERGDRGVLPAVREMAFDLCNDLARIHALWTLEGLGAVDAAVAPDPYTDFWLEKLSTSQCLCRFQPQVRSWSRRNPSARLSGPGSPSSRRAR